MQTEIYREKLIAMTLEVARDKHVQNKKIIENSPLGQDHKDHLAAMDRSGSIGLFRLSGLGRADAERVVDTQVIGSVH